MKLKTIAILVLMLATWNLPAQIAWLTPADPTVDEEVTLTFDAKQGNKALAGYEGTVYLHTGIITDKSLDGGDWKHVVGNWGKADERVKMTSKGNGLYTFEFVIRSFYELRPEEQARQLAFVFRSEEGAKVGKTGTNEDIFLAVNGYRPPVKKEAVYLFETRKYISDSLHGNQLDIRTNHGTVRVTPFTDRIIQIVNLPEKNNYKDLSDAVILQPPRIRIFIEVTDDWLKYKTDSLEVVFHKDPFFAAFVYHGDTILQEEKGYFERSDNNGLRFQLDNNEKIYGLGERANAFNLVGSRYKLYNRPKYGYEIGAKNLNYSIPLVVSSRKYLLLFDNPQKGYADVGETEQQILEWGAIGGTMKYFLIAGNSFKSLVMDYSLLTGRQPMPPRWALGNLQSRMGYRSQRETDSIVRLMQQYDFPIDAVILDFYWFGDSIMGTMGRLDWYKPNWPQPEKMIQKFRKTGVKTILITEPYILDSLANFKIADSLGILATDSLGSSYVNKEFYFGHGALIDIFKPEAQDWFWEQYQKQIKIGVAGWWGDLGEPENHPSDQIHVNGKADEVHNIYGHYWDKMLFEKYRRYHPETRLFNLNRSGFAGSQRYAVYPWTGDVSRSWGGLQAQLPLMLHMSLSGLPFIHSDAGGFAQGTKNDELYTRWLQMACFSPILRPHGSDIPSEPVYFSEHTREIVRNFMKLRYRLLPYIYTTAMQAHLRGYPIVRPLFFEFPEDTATYNISSEYLFGGQFLVAPVVEAGIERLSVYLPGEVKWYNFWDKQKFAGGQWIEVPVILETIPVFVQEGAFIPLVKAVSSTDFYSSQELTVRYFPGNIGDSSAYTIFEDDGKTYGTIGRGEFELMVMKARQPDEKSMQIQFSKDGWDYQGMPLKRVMKLEIVGQSPKAKRNITLNGEKMRKKKESDNFEGFYFNSSGMLVVDFNWDGRMIKIDIIKK
ncbi:MAG: glycoside hydrolase family 31 protein [Bacteroidales bacterium]|nr:glycoside hydrolase family 31 protein [Bacteroidales bacterium]